MDDKYVIFCLIKLVHHFIFITCTINYHHHKWNSGYSLPNRTQMISEATTKEHILKAIDEIDKIGYDKNRESTEFHLKYNNRIYPPKVIISRAYKFERWKRRVGLFQI